MFSIVFLGDTMLGRIVNEGLRKNGHGYVWGDTLSVLQKANWRLMNLECVMSNQGHPWDVTPKVFHFRSDLENIHSLQLAAIDMVSCANNHVLDYGYEAMAEMLDTFDAMSFPYVGVGRNDQEATQMVVSKVDGVSIGVIACTDNEPGWAASHKEMGAYYVALDNDEDCAALVERVRQNSPLVEICIVSIHWGGNWGREVPLVHQRVARLLIDAGASLVFGHSPHILRGVEMYQGCPIIYAAGDFVDDYAIDEDERNDLGAIFHVHWDASWVCRSVELYPTRIQDCQVNLAHGDDWSWVINRMSSACQSFGTKCIIEDKVLRIMA